MARRKRAKRSSGRRARLKPDVVEATFALFERAKADPEFRELILILDQIRTEQGSEALRAFFRRMQHEVASLRRDGFRVAGKPPEGFEGVRG